MISLWRNASKALQDRLRTAALSPAASTRLDYLTVRQPVSLLHFDTHAYADGCKFYSQALQTSTYAVGNEPGKPWSLTIESNVGRMLPLGVFQQHAGFATKNRSAAVPGVPVLSLSRVTDQLAHDPMKEHAEIPFAVKAFYLGSKIDVNGLRSQAETDGFPAHFQKSAKGNESTVICLRKGPLMSEDQHVTGLPLEAYMMAFSYGSVVIFNAHSELLMNALLGMCRDFTKQQQTEHFVEEMMIKLRPNMEAWSTHSPEYIRLKRLDWSNMRVIGSVLGQSVALDFYARNVETMLERFVDMNLEMHKTGSLSASIGKDELLKLVAQNNLILTDIITKLGLLDYHDVAWKTSQYGRIWEYLRRDFDVEARFETLSDKLTLVQENLKYYLELRQHQKSDTLEWIIILMIGAEIAISLYEMSRHLM